MKLSNSFQTALVGLKTNKTRSFLTILGIVIGISSVILMMSLGDGAQGLILKQIMSMGPNNVYVEPGSFDLEGADMTQAMMEGMDIKTLTLDDMDAIEKDPLVESVAPMVLNVARVVYKNNDKKVTVFGTSPAYAEITGGRTILGSNFNDFDVQSMAKVAVLGYKINEDFFQNENPIGKTIRIKDVNFKVIGVMEEQGSQMFLNVDDYVYIPITTVQKFLLGINHIQSSAVKIVSQDKIDEAMESIRLILRERHNIYNPEGDLSKDDFKVVSAKESADMMNIVTGILTMLLSSVAAIALLVGGIGIMNIMLVSVVERTREIGLRKAVGARKKDILYQFLIEAIVLTGLGGIIGILLGIVFAYLAAIVLSMALGTQWSFVVSLKSIVLAFGVAAGIGIVFGIYPARKAAELSPIEALRYE
ncbi:MAG: ABC transporter permease [Candidatus Pacebacteria bacterium]|jgi:putative ABC transport system permease protein|nr:ABC transporter permease [Candidatus Paceibacterota bacterium]MDD4994444.1 ABC transporter permease [Candidatus Paceibacterota bacterium]MDD5535151.1 ABC transporter permease [Candidatus Paceibacterota bacterium]